MVTEKQDIKIGDFVYLRTQPEWKMEVLIAFQNTLFVSWYNLYGEIQSMEIPIKCVVKYKYPQVFYNHISLN